MNRFLSKFAVSLALLLVASCQTTRSPEDALVYSEGPAQLVVAPTAAQHHGYVLYEVTSFDTVASLCRKNKLSAAQFIAINNLKVPYTLKPGMLIKIPDMSSDLEAAVQSAAGKKAGVVHIRPKKLAEKAKLVAP